MIPLNKVEDGNHLEIGDFDWEVDEDGNRTLRLMIPTPTGQCMSEWSINHKNENGAEWLWDGNQDAPSLHPSIHAVNIFHGWVKNGKLYSSDELIVGDVSVPD